MARDPRKQADISDDSNEYSDQDFALILSKATELARKPDSSERQASSFSLAEMKAIAVEAGLDPALIERAARLVPAQSAEGPLTRLLGGPVKYRLEGYFDKKLTTTEAEVLLSAVRAAAEQQGEGSADSAGMSWHSVGEGSQFLVSAHAERDGARVRIVLDRRGGLAIIGMFSGLGALATSIAVVVAGEVGGLTSMPLGLSLIAGCVTGSFALGRAVWTATGRSFRAKADRLMDTVSRVLADDEEPA